jgi:dGTP triphosphohydrolase
VTQTSLRAAIGMVTQDTSLLHRSVADYIAGMTDRFALREHERLTGRKLL